MRRLAPALCIVLAAGACSTGSGGGATSSTDAPPAASTTATSTVVTTTTATTSPPVTTTATTTPRPTTTVPPEAAPPDLVFTGGPIHTMSGSGTVEAVAVTGDRITGVGAAEEIVAAAGPDTRLVDLAGRTLMPGFVDPHTHLLNDAWRLDLDPLGGQQLALENGITTFSNQYTTAEFVEEMRGYEAAGELRARISLYLIATDNCGADQGYWWLDHPPTDEPGELLRIGGIKLFMDGGTCGPWSSSEPALVGVEPGPVFLEPGHLREIYRTANEAGFQTTTHAVGDMAVLAVLDAHAATMEEGNPLRHRVEHVNLVTDAVIEAFAETGVNAVLFGYYPSCGEAFDLTPFGEAHMRRHGDLMAANPDIVFAWHGDDPWVGPVSPLLELWNMTTRFDTAPDGSLCEPAQWLAERTYDVATGLEMMTIDAAYMLRREDEVGSLEVGKYADLIVLSDDPLGVDPMALRDIEVLMTMVGGNVEVCADEAACP